MKGIEAQEESTNDLLSFLFKTLATVPDARFRAWVETKKGEYDEGRPMIDGELLVADSMMILSENKFKGMKQDGAYNVPSPEDEKIVALQADVNKLQKAMGGGSKRPDRGPNDGLKKKKDRPCNAL
jgi:hypothetical protein